MIHPSAIIDPEASIGSNVSIGPYSTIAAGAVIGDDCKIGPHVSIHEATTLGRGCQIHKGANIGDTPQDISWQGQGLGTQIGDNCVLREYVTIHRGSIDGSATVLGNECMLMAFSHVAHDCIIGNHCSGLHHQ